MSVRSSPDDCLTPGWGLWSLVEKTTYKTREPGPYWPDRGQAQTTCSALAEELLAAAAEEKSTTLPRSCRPLSIEAGESAGMASNARHGRGGHSVCGLGMRDGRGNQRDATHTPLTATVLAGAVCSLYGCFMRRVAVYLGVM